MPSRGVTAIVLGLVAAVAVPGASGAAFTLTDAALLTLDCDLDFYYEPDQTASVVATRDVPGPGVEFDIQYTGTGARERSFSWVSTSRGGSGALVGLNLAPYDTFALSFNLVAVNGVTSNAGGRLYVGALIGGQSGPFCIYRPKVVSITGTAPPHVTSDTSYSSYGLTTSRLLGFTIYRLSHSLDGWSESGDLVTVRVSPTPGATPLPEPASGLLLVLGMAAWRRHGPARRTSLT
jgi:hypothetical protein